MTHDPRVISEPTLSLLKDASDCRFTTITEPDAWFNATYDLLSAEFGSAVLDPPVRLARWLEWNRAGTHPFPLVLQVAWKDTAAGPLLLGATSGNVMPLAGSDYAASAGALDWVYAIGNQATAPACRSAGVRGIGRGLWQAGIGEALRQVSARGGRLLYSVLEAETRSLGFWGKVGYRRPAGLDYYQPPLEFDTHGRPRYAPIVEKLLLRAESGDGADTIEGVRLRQIVATLYRYWSLHPAREALAPEAFRRAEQYVMGELLGRVCSTVPEMMALQAPVSE